VVDFIGVGPQKTGSSWLDVVLRAHPQLCLPAGYKETMFFDRRFSRGADWYRRQFRPHSGTLIGECSPTYFDVPEVPFRVRSVSPQCRIIINLRDPVDRAFSLYAHELRRGRVSPNFERALEQQPRILTAGRYALHLSRWLEVFAADRVLLLIFDDIREAPESVFGQICEFLGVARIPIPPVAYEKINAASAPRWPILAKVAGRAATWLHDRNLQPVISVAKRFGGQRVFTGGAMPRPLSAEQRQRLLAEYETDISHVERLAGRDLSCWRTA
jgi:hypothetical protein